MHKIYSATAAILLIITKSASAIGEQLSKGVLVTFYLSFLVKSDILGENFFMCTFQATIGPSVFVFLIV